MTTTMDSTRPADRPGEPGGPDDPSNPGRTVEAIGPIGPAMAIRLALVLIPLVIFADRALLAPTVATLATAGLVATLGMTAAIGSASARRPSTLLVPATIVALAVWLSIRHSPWLVTIDLVAAGLLVALGPSIRGWSDLFATRRFAWVVRVADSVGTIDPLGRAVGRVGTTATGRARRTVSASGASLGGVAASAVVAIVLLALLASGDAVFASFFASPDAGWVVPHLVIWMGAAFVGLWLGFASLRRPRVEDQIDTVRTAPDGAALVLGTVTAVLGLFSLSQLLTVVRGRDWVLQRTGLTFAEYARQGFFQLLWVAAIVLAVLAVTRLMTGADHRRPARRIVVLGSSSAALTIGLVAVSLRRMFLYEDAFGLTMLRLYVMGFAVWMAAVLAATAVATARAAGGRRWLGTFVVGSAVAGVLVLNLVDPEAVVVERNLDRAAAGESLDLHYLAGLSADGRLRLLDAAKDDPAGEIATALCDSRWRFEQPTDGSIWSFNRAADRHRDRLEALCGPAV